MKRRKFKKLYKLAKACHIEYEAPPGTILYFDHDIYKIVWANFKRIPVDKIKKIIKNKNIQKNKKLDEVIRFVNHQFSRHYHIFPAIKLENFDLQALGEVIKSISKTKEKREEKIRKEK